MNVDFGPESVRIRGVCISRDAAVYITFVILAAVSVRFKYDPICMAADSTVDHNLVKGVVRQHLIDCYTVLVNK